MKLVENDDNLTTEKKQEVSTQNSLTVNKRFVVNTLKQVDDHNRIKTNIHSKLLRKFQNEERKKHTLKNLKRFSAQKTLYSDFFAVSSRKKARGRQKIITPLEQVQKLISDAVDFDEEQDEKMLNRVVRKPRVSLDKRLLNNHLKHYSVHNRLKEEGDMWEKHQSHKQRKIVGLETKSSKRLNADTYGGMYADREPGNVKVTRVTETPDVIRLGSATRELLKLEEDMPGRWGHSGFKETYANEESEESEDSEASEVEEYISPVKSSSIRNIVVSRRIAERLNSSIELSDDDVEIVPPNRSRKIGSRVVVNKLKRKRIAKPKKVIEQELICVEEAVPSKKKSIVKLVPKRVKVIKPVRNKPKKTVAKKVQRSTLQADLIITERNRKNIKRTDSPRWGHDGFQEINVDEPEPSQKSVKSRLQAIDIDNGGEDSEVSIDFPRLNINKKTTKINKTNKIASSNEPNDKANDSVQLSDSDEWTEKEVIAKLPKNDARRKLKQNKDQGTGVNKVTLKNGIHEGKGGSKGGSIKDRLTLSARHQSNRTGEIGSRNGRRRDDDVSSLTDSSSDERFKRRIDEKKQHVMRDRKYYNNRNRR